MKERTKELRPVDTGTVVLQTVKIALWGLLALALIGLAILELIPRGGSGLTMKESFEIYSSPIDAGNGKYASAIGGTIFNPTDDRMDIQSVTVTVAAGRRTKDVVLEGFVLPPRTTRELSSDWSDAMHYDRIDRITVVTANGSEEISNSASSAFGGAVWIYLILLFPVGGLLWNSIKVRRYLEEEKVLMEQSEQ